MYNDRKTDRATIKKIGDRKLKRELVGHIGVDSGCVMIVDPCYFQDPMRWKPENLEKMALEHFAKNEQRMGENTHRMATEKRQLQNIVSDWPQFCTDSQETKHQPREYASGVITPTKNGDGSFPVYVTKDKDGRVTKMEIVF